MFGGLAAAILAMERVSARPIIWATAQYLDNAWLGSVVDLDIIVPVQVRHRPAGSLNYLTFYTALREQNHDKAHLVFRRT